MFNLQGSELIIILLLALVVLGPEKLPDAMRKAGQFYAELKKMSTGFQTEFRAAVDEPLRELRETANTIRDSADFTKFQSGEREEKPKSAEMLAAADPDVVPTDELPFRPDESGSTEPASEPTADAAPPSPGDQEPFMPVKFTGGRAVEAEPATGDARRPASTSSPSGSQISSVSPPAGSPVEQDGEDGTPAQTSVGSTAAAASPRPATNEPFKPIEFTGGDAVRDKPPTDSTPEPPRHAPSPDSHGANTAETDSCEAAGEAEQHDVNEVDVGEEIAAEGGQAEASG